MFNFRYRWMVLISFFFLNLFQLRGDFNQVDCWAVIGREIEDSWLGDCGKEFSGWRVLGGNFSPRKQTYHISALLVFAVASFSFFIAYSSIPSALVFNGSATDCRVNEWNRSLAQRLAPSICLSLAHPISPTLCTQMCKFSS